MAHAIKTLRHISGIDGADGTGFDPSSDWQFPSWYFGPKGTGATTPIVLYNPEDGSAVRATAPDSTGATTTAASATPSAGSPFVINIIWDASVASAPTGFTTAILAAVDYLQRQFTDPVQINIAVGWGEVHGSVLPSNAIGASVSYLAGYTYATVRKAIAGDASTTDDQSAVASLPSTAPVTGNFWTTTAQAKALGLISGTSTALDGAVGFSTGTPFTFSGTVAGGTYDFNAVALHELTEVMGRLLLTGATIGTYTNSYSAYDLFHWSAPGTRDFAASTPGYFSTDSGATNLGNFNTVAGADPGDWASSPVKDAFDAFGTSGITVPVSTNDIRAMDAIGWNRAGTLSPAPIPSALAAAQGASGLAANASLVALSLANADANTYTFALGGAGAASFVLSSANNQATVAAGASGVAGAANGRLYALNVTPMNAATAASGPATPLNVIVGNGNGNTVSISTLTGALGTATPTFVYGLGGADSINASGMTGKVWLNGGGGADTMGGGSGVTTYLYGATSDSTAAAMDVISNFHTASDFIDLTGLGTSLAYAGQLSSSTLAAKSVGWQVGSGRTNVYVNTSAASEALTSTDMKIALSGALSLKAGNFTLA
ncbi:MAG: NF038122 family metalloprotease [Proteobacteria bacterium]|nr:NF038122 family metalloprotease [Pseudomonadota bacterium]